GRRGGHLSVALIEGSSPGVERRLGAALLAAEGANGQSAALPALQQSPPVAFLARITRVALWHGQNLRDRVKENHVPRLNDHATMVLAGRLPPFSSLQPHVTNTAKRR